MHWFWRQVWVTAVTVGLVTGWVVVWTQVFHDRYLKIGLAAGVVFFVALDRAEDHQQRKDRGGR